MLGIVILNYNTWIDTVKCIQSICNHLKSSDYKIYVVDNKSPKKIDDNSLLYLENNTKVELIFHNENKGYSAGNNVGLKKSIDDECDYVMICNSDIIFVDETIDNMIEFLKNNKNVGLVGPQIYNKDDVFQPLYMKCKLTGIGKIKNMMLHTKLSFLVKKFRNKFIMFDEVKKPTKMFGVSGCCFMMTSKCLKYLYPLDETTFLYEEEYIIGAILENSDFDVYVIPNTHVIHNHSVSIGGISRFSYNCLIESEQHYLKKYIKSPFVMRKMILMIRKILILRIKK